MSALLTFAASAAAASSYPVYWNVNEGSDPPVDVASFKILRRNWTQCGNGCSNPNCKPFAWPFPTITDAGEAVHGGVPQAGNFSGFQQSLKEGIPQWIPDPDWDGNAVLDFEAWTTVWELNTGSGNWHGDRYRTLSKKIVQDAHPTWTKEQVEAEAKKEFEAAATKWFVEVLTIGRSLRPKARWGYYGLPVNLASPCLPASGPNMRCGYDGPLGELYRGYSDKQKPVWAASTAIYPSIYIPPHLTHDHAVAYVNNTVREAQRCAAGVSGVPPVYPYMWSRYHNGTTLLDAADLSTSLQLPRSLGAQGLVIWGSEKGTSGDAFWKYLNTTLGPAVEALY